jgi:hypothetical protein
MNHGSDFQEIIRRAGLFRESMILFAAVELDLFSCLEEEPQRASDLAWSATLVPWKSYWMPW